MKRILISTALVAALMLGGAPAAMAVDRVTVAECESTVPGYTGDSDVAEAHVVLNNNGRYANTQSRLASTRISAWTIDLWYRYKNTYTGAYWDFVFRCNDGNHTGQIGSEEDRILAGPFQASWPPN